MTLSLVVMAAGLGSRYGGLKQVEAVGPSGEAILDYSIYDALRAGFGRIVFVVGGEVETPLRDRFGARWGARVDLSFVRQELARLPEGFLVPTGRRTPWGTGHATLAAEAVIDEPFAVINADDFYGADAYKLVQRVLRYMGPEGTDFSMVGFPILETLSKHGPVSRSICECSPEGDLVGTRELRTVAREGSAVLSREGEDWQETLRGDEVVSMNFWAFTPAVFDHLRRQFSDFLRETALHADAEFYLPAAIDRLVSGGVARVRVLEGKGPWFGLTYPADKPDVVRAIRALVDRGVYPERLWD